MQVPDVVTHKQNRRVTPFCQILMSQGFASSSAHASRLHLFMRLIFCYSSTISTLSLLHYSKSYVMMPMIILPLPIPARRQDETIPALLAVNRNTKSNERYTGIQPIQLHRPTPVSIVDPGSVAGHHLQNDSKYLYHRTLSPGL